MSLAPDEPTTSPRLAQHTTLRVGGPARRWIRAHDQAELIAAVAGADSAGEPVLVLGGGSNLVVDDAGFKGLVVSVETRGVQISHLTRPDAQAGVRLTVAAGEDFDALVARTVDEGWIGIEALSGIPGRVGATPIQNVGAYGAEMASVISGVRVWDRRRRQLTELSPADCAFGYRHSALKADPGRWIVLAVMLDLRSGHSSPPVRYAELARSLGIAVGQTADPARVREAVLGLRSAKGMVLDDQDHDTWSAGSFFTNPLLDAATAQHLPPDAPRFAHEDRVKTSAAWLIEQAGFGKGYGAGPATLSTKHTLAVTNRGHARSADVVALAREVRAGVADRFGITLVNEPVMINCRL